MDFALAQDSHPPSVEHAWSHTLFEISHPDPPADLPGTLTQENDTMSTTTEFGPTLHNQTSALSPGLALEATTRAEVDIQIATAHRFPRDMEKVRAEIMASVTMDPDSAAGCYYVIPRGGRDIEGPSIRLAEIVMSAWGNSRVVSRVVEVQPDGEMPFCIVQAVAHDLERNISWAAEKRRRITKKRAKSKPDEDDVQLACAAAASMASRDAILKVIPKLMWGPALTKAREIVRGQMRSTGAHRERVFARFRQLGVDQARVLAALGKEKIEEVTPEDIEELVGLGMAIREGETTLEEAFPVVVKAPAFDKPASDEKPGQEATPLTPLTPDPEKKLL
jgi:hypothetical protein